MRMIVVRTGRPNGVVTMTEIATRSELWTAIVIVIESVDTSESATGQQRKNANATGTHTASGIGIATVIGPVTLTSPQSGMVRMAVAVVGKVEVVADGRDGAATRTRTHLEAIGR